VRSQIDLWVEGILNQRLFLRDQYHVSLVNTVRSLAAMGGVVFIGRGAHIILADSASLRICVIGSVGTRARNVMRYEGVDEQRAREMIAAADASRAEFLRKIFHAEPSDPHQFDLVLNADTVPPERMVEVAMAALEAKGVFAG
jgi:cytidylate kinase